MTTQYILIETHYSDDDYKVVNVVDFSSNKEELEAKCEEYNKLAREEDSFEDDAREFYNAKQYKNVEIPDEFLSFVRKIDDETLREYIKEGREEGEIPYLEWEYYRPRTYYSVQEVREACYKRKNNET